MKAGPLHGMFAAVAVCLMCRVGAAEAAAETRHMSGHYIYFADAAVFTDCASGERIAVAEEGDNVALQRAYLAARSEPGAAMLVTVEGRVEARPPVEGSGPMRPVLIVERFVGISAGPCGPPRSTARPPAPAGNTARQSTCAEQ